MNDFIIRPIQNSDFIDGYLELTCELTDHNKVINEAIFNSYVENNLIKTIVVYSKTMKKIIGVGSIFILQKLHCNSVGQIEDVIVHQEFRKKWYRKNDYK